MGSGSLTGRDLQGPQNGSPKKSLRCAVSGIAHYGYLLELDKNSSWKRGTLLTISEKDEKVKTLPDNSLASNQFLVNNHNACLSD